MELMWPHMLWLLLAAPALVGAYLLMLRRRKAALRYASLDLVRQAAGRGHRMRRHLPPLLLLLSAMVAVVAVARPHAVVTLPSEQRTIILAIDVSLSMRANDIEPNRLAAAQAAAKSFIDAQPSDVRIGIVSFAGTAAVVQPPTRRRADLIAAVNRLQLDRHTAIGSGILVSLAALFPEETFDLEAVIFGQTPSRDGGRSFDRRNGREEPLMTPVPPASYSSAAVILLTDGRRTIGPDPLHAARMAADRGVRVFTVGFGTTEGAVVDADGWSIYMRFDEETLRAIADITHALYFQAASASDLKDVYEGLNARLVLERAETEITALFSAAAAALAAIAALLSLLWSSRLG